MVSPLLNYGHEIICAVEVRDKEEALKEGEIPPSAGMAMLMMFQAKNENKNANVAARCYGFYVYADSDIHEKDTSNRYNMKIRNGSFDLLDNNCCVGIEIYA